MKLLAMFVGVVVALGGGAAASASTATVAQNPYTTKLLRAVDTCKTRVTPETTFPQVKTCTRSLAAPQQDSAEEADIWRLVLDCLWLGWTPGRGDGGFDNDTVNECLDRGGVW